MKRRLPAFTIMELTIALLLSALVIAITYSAFSLVSRYYADYHQKHEEMAVLIRLDELLGRDFAKAKGIHLDEAGDSDTYAFADSLQTVRYRFTPDYIIRSSTVTDTFKVTVSEVKATFEGQPVTSETILPDSAESRRLDALSFRVLYKSENFPYHYRKRYSAQDLISRKNHALR